MQPEKLYHSGFYRRQADDSHRSAVTVLSHLFRLYRPSSVLDVGCGAGTWLRAAMDLGIRDVFGIDGHALSDSELRIPHSSYLKVDLAHTTPIIGRRFDLAMSLEVGEHLPPSRASALVSVLTDASDVVLFSAAVPGQGGRHHINEQFPSFWIPLFARLGFRCFDAIRPPIWGLQEVDVWYRQNVLLFAKDREFDGELPTARAYDRVHPESWLDPKLVQRRIRRALRVKVRAMFGRMVG